jgi:hypothetical protein
VKVHVANYESRISLAAWLLNGDCGQQTLKIEGMRAAGVLQRPGPQIARSVGGQLDAVAIGVGQVDELSGAPEVYTGRLLERVVRWPLGDRAAEQAPRDFLVSSWAER